MTTETDPHELAALRLTVGPLRPDGIEIIDETTHQPVALIYTRSDRAVAVAQLFATAADLLYAIARTRADLHCDEPPVDARLKKLCRLLKDVYKKATARK